MVQSKVDGSGQREEARNGALCVSFGLFVVNVSISSEYSDACISEVIFRTMKSSLAVLSRDRAIVLSSDVRHRWTF